MNTSHDEFEFRKVDFAKFEWSLNNSKNLDGPEEECNLESINVSHIFPVTDRGDKGAGQNCSPMGPGVFKNLD